MNKGKLNWVERSIAALSPGVAFERAQHRAALEVMVNREGKRAYEAGRRSRTPADRNVNSNGSSANSEIAFDLTWLRERSRQLVRDNPYAKNAVEVITTNVIGTGIRPSIPKKVIPIAQERNLMNAYKLWAESTECDYNGQLNLYGLQALAWKASVEGGDGFLRIINMPTAKNGIVPIKLQVLEADYLDHTRDGQVLPNGNYIRLGVEFDQNHQRVAYWMFKNHPSENFIQAGTDFLSVRVLKKEIIHIYEVLRPGQIRGIPHGVASFLRIKDLDHYEDAQLKRQLIAACYSVFVKKAEPDFIGTYKDQDEYNKKNGIEIPAMSEAMEPGRIEYLNPGEDISFANPPGTTGYEPYTRNVLRSIAAGYLITYESMTGDYSNVNFSSGRMGKLKEDAKTHQWQELSIKPLLNQPIWNAFMDSARIAGIYNGKAVAAEWTPPKRSMIDPYKEAKGYEVLIRLGIMSRSDAARQLGTDPEKLIAEIEAEQKEQDSSGMMLTSDPKWDAARVNYGADMAIKIKQASASAKASPKESTKKAKPKPGSADA